MAPILYNAALDGHKLLILQGFTPKPEWVQKIRTKFPGLKLEYLEVPEDAVNLPSELYKDLTMILTYQTLPTKAQSPNLKYVQLSSAGCNHIHNNEHYQDPSTLVCTANGIHPPQISEWVIGTFLASQHHFSFYQNLQQQAHWDDLTLPEVEDSIGLRMGILGYGAIGRQCARVAKAMGMDIFAYTMRERSTPSSRADDSYCVPGTGDPEGLLPSAWYHGRDRASVNHFLAQDLDILVICLPLTALTKHIIGAEQFKIMSKKRTFLSNIGRGSHVVTEDLIHALETGLIRGAALDVTDPEPLPDGHPLWSAKNCIITPHVSWASKGAQGRVLAVLEENLDRLSQGLSPVNVVDRELSY